MARLFRHGLAYEAAETMYDSLDLLLAIREPLMEICHYRLVLAAQTNAPVSAGFGLSPAWVSSRYGLRPSYRRLRRNIASPPRASRLSVAGSGTTVISMPS